MKIKILYTIATVAIATFSFLSTVKPADATSVKLVGLSDRNTLISFDSSNPRRTTTVAITGVNGTLIGIDFRPADGLLYGVTTTNEIYVIDTATGSARLKGTLSVPFNGEITTGFDFNPVPDRLRLVSSGNQNFRINVDPAANTTTAAVADFDANTPGVQPDGNVAYSDADTATGLPKDINFGNDPSITAVAYTNSFAGPPSPAGATPPTRTTQLFGIDSSSDVLVLQNPPNNGTLRTIGALGVDFGNTGGFDIFSSAAGENIAFAASGATLYTINLETGTATAVGRVGRRSHSVNLVGLAAVPAPAVPTP